MKEEKRIAIEECLKLWKYCAITGIDKKDAVKRLYERGELSQASYQHDCPFCELYNNNTIVSEECKECSWPTYENYENYTEKCRCQYHSDSPYKKYWDLRAWKFSCKNRKPIASEVYQYLKKHLAPLLKGDK